jgi:hypothetical protein
VVARVNRRVKILPLHFAARAHHEPVADFFAVKLGGNVARRVRDLLLFAKYLFAAARAASRYSKCR